MIRVLDNVTLDDLTKYPEDFEDILDQYPLVLFPKLNATEEQKDVVAEVFGLSRPGDHERKRAWQEWFHFSRYEVTYNHMFKVMEDMGKASLKDVLLESRGPERVNVNESVKMNPWHYENNEMLNPPVHGLWSMDKFPKERGIGRTGFIDGRLIYERMPDRFREFSHRVQTVSVPGYMPVDMDWFRDQAYRTVAQGEPFWIPVPETSDAIVVHPKPLAMEHPVTGRYVVRSVTPFPPQDPGKRPKEMWRLWHQSEMPKNNTWGETYETAYKHDFDIYANGGQQFLEEECDPQLLFDFKVWLYEYIETETNQFWLQWNEGDLLALDIFSLMHAVEGGFNKNERLLRGRYYFGKCYTGDPHGKRPVAEFI